MDLVMRMVELSENHPAPAIVVIGSIISNKVRHIQDTLFLKISILKGMVRKFP